MKEHPILFKPNMARAVHDGLKTMTRRIVKDMPTKPTFTPEYFSALNEKDAEKYVGKTMEFADGTSVKSNKWKKCTFKGPYNKDTNWTFKSKHNFWQFMRTCPETFAKKKVKKIVERWVNIYPPTEKGGNVYDNEKDAHYGANHTLRIACVKLTGEYEVEE